ncbi:hypothetical protein [Lacipirellula limnantheis]|uniref:Uncharacterized protein n=1 Tax=Lacipirellula limnantheis TaxID=2528024 RepID=A0A517TRG7_9BACT|nr:hypothetical protein [Lacipirellula limnantheis]QDT70967.1 hypothetical protein I41_01220 [Lacipirellula limnantheis]
MAKKKRSELLRKSDTSFGSAFYDSTNLPVDETKRSGFQIRLRLEDGLKLQLSLQQALWELNRLDQRSPRSREQGVALTFFPHQKRIMVTHGVLKYPSRPNLKKNESDV